jgi:hypothetical protein
MTDTSNIVWLQRQQARERHDADNAAPAHFNDDLLQVDRTTAEFASIMAEATSMRQVAGRLLANWWRKATHTS